MEEISISLNSKEAPLGQYSDVLFPIMSVFFSFREVILYSFSRWHRRWRAGEPQVSSWERGGGEEGRSLLWSSGPHLLASQPHSLRVKSGESGGGSLSPRNANSATSPAVRGPPGISLVLLVLWDSVTSSIRPPDLKRPPWGLCHRFPRLVFQ